MASAVGLGLSSATQFQANSAGQVYSKTEQHIIDYLQKRELFGGLQGNSLAGNLSFLQALLPGPRNPSNYMLMNTKAVLDYYPADRDLLEGLELEDKEVWKAELIEVCGLQEKAVADIITGYLERKKFIVTIKKMEEVLSNWLFSFRISLSGGRILAYSQKNISFVDDDHQEVVSDQLACREGISMDKAVRQCMMIWERIRKTNDLSRLPCQIYAIYNYVSPEDFFKNLDLISLESISARFVIAMLDSNVQSVERIMEEMVLTEKTVCDLCDGMDIGRGGDFGHIVKSLFYRPLEVALQNGNREIVQAIYRSALKTAGSYDKSQYLSLLEHAVRCNNLDGFLRIFASGFCFEDRQTFDRVLALASDDESHLNQIPQESCAKRSKTESHQLDDQNRLITYLHLLFPGDQADKQEAACSEQ